MATIKLPPKYDQTRVLLADDEPEHLDWLVDYLVSKGLQVDIVTNVGDAIVALESKQYRIYFLDLNIPLGGWSPPPLQVSDSYDAYHGFFIVKIVRSQGNKGSNVIVYSAHENPAIKGEIKRLYCEYFVKGRPRDLKVKIEDILKVPPPPSVVPKARPKASVKKVAIKKNVKPARKPRKASRFRRKTTSAKK